jgi:glycosyltransferase involved in cell wall biosynthesis
VSDFRKNVPLEYPRPLSILHISGRSDHGGGPEHLFQVISTESKEITHFIACPESGVYWTRYENCLTKGRLIAIPHRRFSLFAAHRLRKFIIANGIDIIHSHGTCAGLYSRSLSMLVRIPVIHTFHGVPVTFSAKHIAHRYVENFLSHITNQAIAVSDGEASIIRNRWPVYRDKLSVIYNGIKEIPPADFSEKFSKKSIKIISFSRNNHQKNPDLLIELASCLSKSKLDFHVEVYGEGIADPSLLEKARKRGLGKIISFHAPNDDPASILSRGDIYLSTSRWEGMPISILEAWRSGLLVVATDVVGNRDLIEDHLNGRLYASDDGEEAARVIESLVSDKLEMERLRRNAVIAFQNQYTQEAMTNMLWKVYSRCASGRTIATSSNRSSELAFSSKENTKEQSPTSSIQEGMETNSTSFT